MHAPFPRSPTTAARHLQHRSEGRGAPETNDPTVSVEATWHGRRSPGLGSLDQGEGDQQSQLAQLSGMSGYPYLALGDSLVWTGRLRENVYIRYSLRVTGLSEDGLRLAGTADLSIIRN